MKISDMAKEALKNNDYATLRGVVDHFRFVLKMNYDQQYEWFVKNVNEKMSKHQREELMQEIDDE